MNARALTPLLTLAPWDWAAMAAWGVASAALATLALRHRRALLRHPALASQRVRYGRAFELLRLRQTPEQLLALQCLGVPALLAWGALGARPAPALAAALLAWAPDRLLQRAATRRRLRIEGQLGPFLRCLSNALHASPSLATGLQMATGLLPGELAEEVALALRCHRLGTPLGPALQQMATRIGSPVTSGAVLTLVLAQHGGGDLPRTLRATSAALQEMVRLQGVVRSKTSEGRGQAMLIGGIPLPLLAVMHWLDPTFFVPLRTLVTGQLLSAAAAGLWLAAALSARRILDVDI